MSASVKTGTQAGWTLEAMLLATMSTHFLSFSFEKLSLKPQVKAQCLFWVPTAHGSPVRMLITLAVHLQGSANTLDTQEGPCPVQDQACGVVCPATAG